MKLRFSPQRPQESHLTPDCFNKAAQCPKVLDCGLTGSPRGVNIWNCVHVKQEAAEKVTCVKQQTPPD